MRIKSIELKLEWPNKVQISNLSTFVIKKLREYGDPLRWAITNISSSDGLRKLNIEAVVIIK